MSKPKCVEIGKAYRMYGEHGMIVLVSAITGEKQRWVHTHEVPGGSERPIQYPYSQFMRKVWEEVPCAIN